MLYNLVRRRNYENLEIAHVSSTLDVKNLFYVFNEDGTTEIKDSSGNNISFNSDDFVFVRKANNYNSIFGKVVGMFFGVKLDRPIDSLVTRGMPKVSSEIKKHKSHTNKIKWYFSFSGRSVLNNINSIRFPIVYKPVNGSHGNGIKLISNADELSNLVNTVSGPFFLQEFLVKRFEYRVITYNGRVVNSARKMLKTAEGNQFGGRRFKSCELHSDYISYIRDNSEPGVVGIDICRIRGTDKIYIIEQNRAMEFEAIDRATNSSTIELLIREMGNNSES